ncbi:sensor histidine kinase [Mucilaginibacter calamicampi]|uniref:Sensor histidine kinase n=1 Tax=Mucilaginibacter calamicampi TaxID=1302352 RepID=A0ABW2YU27_9SPHI
MKFSNDAIFNVVFWLLYFLYQWMGLASLYGDYGAYFINACLALPVSLLFSIITIHVFFRKFYQRGRRLAFWMCVITTSVLLLLIRRYFNYYIMYPRYFPIGLHMGLFSFGKLLVEFANLYAISGLYALYYFIRYWYQEKHRVQELLQQKTLSELELLKMQVQPHFVFNTLNNIYGTALKTSAETAQLIAHLSGFLSYNLYDARERTVKLTDELAYIKNYIELQKNRYGSRLDVAVNVFDDVSDISLAPLLLLPLIENCFKHGVAGSVEKSWVRVDVSRQTELFSVTIENSCDNMMKQNEGNGGIGLANVKKRLELLYPDRHELKTIEGENSYLVILKINMESK